MTIKFKLQKIVCLFILSFVQAISISYANNSFISTLEVQHSSKCLNIENKSIAEGANALQLECDNNLNQSFEFTSVAGKASTYTIKAQHSGHCLDVEGEVLSKGANIIQWECNGGDNQQFKLKEIADHIFEIRAVHSGHCVDVFGEQISDNANVIQWSCNGDQNQQWRIDASDSPSPPFTIKGGKVADPNKFLTFSLSSEKNDFFVKRTYFSDHLTSSFGCVVNVKLNNTNQQITDFVPITTLVSPSYALYSSVTLPNDTAASGTVNKDDPLNLAIDYTCQSPLESPTVLTVLNRDFEEIVDSSVTVKLDDIRNTAIIPASNKGNGSKKTAVQYYQALDAQTVSEEKKTTLDNWYSLNGFNGKSQCVNQSNDCIVKAVYLNNVDLKLGRLMRLHVSNDKQDSVAGSEVFVCVENYASLQKAIDADKNDDRAGMIAAVCMEYALVNNDDISSKSSQGTLTRVTTFYSYNALGERTTVVDLDGRGDKYQPGVCMSCHGGKNNEMGFLLPANTTTGFIPWDLDNFVFSQEAGYTRADQETAFRLMNESVLQTYPENSPIRELVHGWYTTAGLQPTEAIQKTNKLASNTFNGRYVQSGWIDDQFLYHQVYARSCRSCHMQQTLYGSDNIPDFNTLQQFEGYSNTIYNYVYERGIMPLAKRTFDLFWNDLQAGSQAEILYNTLQRDDPFDADIHSFARTMPGKPIAAIKITKKLSELHVILDGTDSLFADTYSWTLVSKPINSQAALLGASTSVATLALDNRIEYGNYEVALRVSRVEEGNTIEESRKSSIINIKNPNPPPPPPPKPQDPPVVPAVVFSKVYSDVVKTTCLSCHGETHSSFKMHNKTVAYANWVQKVEKQQNKKCNSKKIKPNETLIIKKLTLSQPSHSIKLKENTDKEKLKIIREWIKGGCKQ